MRWMCFIYFFSGRTKHQFNHFTGVFLSGLYEVHSMKNVNKVCLASLANFIYGQVLAMVLSYVPSCLCYWGRWIIFLGQVIGNASEGKYNTSSREVTFQKCLYSGITLFSSKNSNKSQTFATGAYQRLHEARPRRVVWLWEPEYNKGWDLRVGLHKYNK